MFSQDGLQSIPLDSVSFAWTSQSLAAVMPRPLPGVRDWCANNALASIRMSCVLLLHVIDQLKKSDVTSLKLSVVDCQLHILNSMLLENCPVGCLSDLSGFVEQSLVDLGVSASSSDLSVATHSQFARGLPDVILKPLDAIMKHPNLSRLQELTQVICGEEGIYPVQFTFTVIESQTH